MLGKYVENTARFTVSSGEQRQSFKADHGVASPVGKPMIAGDNRMRAGGAFFLFRIDGRDDELIGRQH